MLKAPLYNVKGERAGEIELPEAVFGVPSNDTLLHQVYVAIATNLRNPIAHTKDRGERSGSGKKPWKQKGTGRARIGSIRAPHWRKGGVVFGPSNERNFSKQTNRKMRQKALRIALSEKLRSEKLFVIDNLLFPEQKTKRFAEMLSALGAVSRKVLVGLAGSERETDRMIRNIAKTTDVLSENMSAFDLLNHEYLVLSKESVKLFSDRFAGGVKKEKAEKKFDDK